jgi:hypothetical protein
MSGQQWKNLLSEAGHLLIGFSVAVAKKMREEGQILKAKKVLQELDF